MTISKHVHEACKQEMFSGYRSEINHHCAMATNNGGLRFSDPGCRASASVVDPGSFGLLPSITFLPKLEMFQSLFICCVHM